MTFWDSSALVALFVKEPDSEVLEKLAEDDPRIVVWWGSVVEVRAAIASKVRNRAITKAHGRSVKVAIEEAFTDRLAEIPPSSEIRSSASDLSEKHSLSAADALQLAAFLDQGEGDFVCLDRRLRDAALAEGAAVLP